MPISRRRCRYGLWDRLAVLPKDATSFVHETLNPGLKTYQYALVAFNGAGTSGFVTASAQTPMGPPSAPINLIVVKANPKAVQLAWTDTATTPNPETGFLIECRKVLPNGTVQVNPDNVFTTGPKDGTGGVTFTDTTAAKSTTYEYRVAAFNADKLSAFTPPVLAQVSGGTKPPKAAKNNHQPG